LARVLSDGLESGMPSTDVRLLEMSR